LVQFQLLSRQNFDMSAYMDNYMNSFTGVNGGMAGMFMGAEGSPFKYDVKNSDGAIGGNPSVSPYLTGPVIPADANERGWKDVIRANYGQVMTYMVRFAPTDLPLWWPKSLLRYGFDPSKGPGYVWHCHIVEHEDNDMMRPMDVLPNPSRLATGPRRVMADTLINTNVAINGFALEQNTPNPCNTETEIRFQIPNDMHVQLKLYNSLGVELKVLLDVNALAGNHTVTLYTDNLPSGTYIYQFTAGDFRSTKKLMIKK